MNIQDIFLKINSKLKILLIRLFNKRIKIEKGVTIRRGVIFRAISGRIEIGNNCFFNNYCSINSLKKISIGDDCIFGEGVKIYDHNHIYGKNVTTSKSGYNVDEIKIKNNVWIGSNVTILKGVTIGNNVVIGANSLIYKDVPDNSLVLNNNELKIKEII